MKVYETVAKNYQDFSFYNRNGILTLCSNPEFPYIRENSMYDGQTKQWTEIHLNNIVTSNNITLCSFGTGIVTCGHQINVYHCPSWVISKEYYIDHIKEQLNPLLETAVVTYGNEPFNIFVFKKYLKIYNRNDLLSIGLCVQPKIKGKRCHTEFTNHCQKLISLKAFW